MSASILDDEKRLAVVDREGELQAIESYPTSLSSFLAGLGSHQGRGAEEVVIAGMGGSAISGDYLDNWLYTTSGVPVYVWRDYGLPSFVDAKSLVVTISYSGNTEETISAAREAMKRGANVYGVTSGGALAQLLGKDRVYWVPAGMQPRVALPFLFAAAAKALHDQWVIGDDQWSEVMGLPGVLDRAISAVGHKIPYEQNESKKLAEEMNGHLPVIYGYGIYRSVARRFKTQVNENAKAPAKFEEFPELDHNEIEGWDGGDSILKDFYIISVRDEEMEEPYLSRIGITMSEISQKAGGFRELFARGKTPLEKMFDATLKGDLASVYLAILRGVDPSPVSMIESLKRRLADVKARGD